MKKLVEFGVASAHYETAEGAACHTYTTNDGKLVSTTLIFPENPCNEVVERARVILDMGCGIGRNLPWIMENTSATYIGIDPNPAMHQHFWTIQDAKWKPRVILCRSFDEMRELAKGMVVDVVVCTFVFQHIGFRPNDSQMNVVDITKATFEFSRPGTTWIMYEHDWEEQWIDRWMEECGVRPSVYNRDWTGLHELTHRRPHHLIIWQTP